VADALGRTRFVITSGGLGPTRDDLTKHAVAGVFGLPLEFRADLWDELVARWARLGRKLAEKNRCQAEVPEGALVLPNPRGTAPGLWIAGAAGEVVLLPGVPAELVGLVEEQLIPRLLERAGGRVVRSLLLRTTGIPESQLAARVEPLEPAMEPVTLAYLPGLDGVDLRLTAWDVEPAEADRLLAAAAERLRPVLGEHAYAAGEQDLAAVLLDALRARGFTLAVVESCTGGLLGARVTAVPGSSDVFAGGTIAYANALKEALGVSPRILERHGAVSEEAVRALAEAARARYRTSLALAVSGIAGPGGGSAEKPVGLVWFGIASEAGTEARRTVFPGSRQDIRQRAAQTALWLLWRLVETGALPRRD
jgi:nicotinamide-nucleotide amidase